MEVKEAINWIFDIWHEWENIYGSDAEQNLESGKKLDQVIALLQRGEKFEEMWKEIRSEYVIYKGEKKIMQKYFPKEEADTDV